MVRVMLRMLFCLVALGFTTVTLIFKVHQYPEAVLTASLGIALCALLRAAHLTYQVGWNDTNVYTVDATDGNFFRWKPILRTLPMAELNEVRAFVSPRTRYRAGARIFPPIIRLVARHGRGRDIVIFSRLFDGLELEELLQHLYRKHRDAFGADAEAMMRFIDAHRVSAPPPTPRDHAPPG